MSDIAARRQRLRRSFRALGIDALLVTRATNVSYLSGFTGDDSFLLVSRDRQWLLSDPRYATQLVQECPDVELVIRAPGETLITVLAQTVASARLGRLGLEADWVTLAQFQQLEQALSRTHLASTTGLVEGLREIKDRDEIATIRRAIRVAQRAFEVLRATLQRDQTEKEVADALEHQVRRLGGQGTSFPPIIAAGPRSALPHARPTTAPIGDAELVLVDWGATVDHYRSDLTRVLATAKISPKLERVYGVVAEARAQAVAAIRPGATGHEVDQAAREVIEKAGYGKNFGHGLGHGIGWDIHEGPRLAKNQHRPLRSGMVVTVEPGIYLPGWGGVRIEDDVLVTRDGHEVLSHLPLALEEMVVELER